MTITKKGAGAEHHNAPFGSVSEFKSAVITPDSKTADKVREGAEIVFRPASNILCSPRSLASRFVEEIALGYKPQA